MKLSSETLDILKNFSTINPSIVIRPGNKLRTNTPTKTILADAIVAEDFPTTICIYNLSKLLSAMTLFGDDIDIDFKEKYLTLSNGKQSSDFYYADESMVIAADAREISINDPDVELDVSWSDIDTVIKAAGIYEFPDIAFVGDGSKCYLKAIDPEKKNRTTDSFSIEVGTTEDTFQQVIEVANIKIMQGDYKVKLSQKGLASFEANNMKYFIPMKRNDSTYTKA